MVKLFYIRCNYWLCNGVQ